jgi:hypothetical protein
MRHGIEDMLGIRRALERVDGELMGLFLALRVLGLREQSAREGVAAAKSP